MPVNSDFSDLLSALNDEGVEYLLVGGYAVAFHAAPRYTKDLDIWVRPEPANAVRVLRALAAFGAPLSGVTADDFARTGNVFMMGVPPNRIDVLTSIDGVEFAEAWADRVATTFAGQEASLIGRRQLLANKIASARPQDLLDAEALRKHEP